MAEETKETKDKKGVADGGGEDGTGLKMLYETITHPTDEQMPQMTDLPLTSITPLSWMATYDEVFEEAVAYVKYATEMREYEDAMARGNNGVEKPKEPAHKLPSRTYREWLYRHRRSLSGAGMKTVAVLAERQLEVQQEEQNPDQLSGLIKD